MNARMNALPIVLPDRGRRELTVDMIALFAESTRLAPSDRARFIIETDENLRALARRFVDSNPRAAFYLADAQRDFSVERGL